MKLFAVLLGGRASGCHIELHDVVFTVGKSLEETYPLLVNKWFGESNRLHVDSSVELCHVDGYQITIKPHPPINQDNQLYFVNFGGYEQQVFGEMHHVGFYVCSSKKNAIIKAKKELCVGLTQQHCDDNFTIAVDDLIQINKVDHSCVHLEKTNIPAKLDIQSHYRRLDVPAIIEKASLLAS
ncbi:MAG: hypothetical protein COB50_02090 [Thiotrichales bacterium]|nr:MAG: hypothetical protein COB50_02090 [Thiotrichales bacterium]